jgi:hypothetical protein
MKLSSQLKQAKRLAVLMDAQFSFLGIRFGLDSLIGLVPGLGDIVAFAFSAYLIWIGIQLQLPPIRILQMILNASADTLVGSIPVVGDIADVFFRANLKNLAILEKYAPHEYIEGEVVHDSASTSLAR